MMFPHHTFEMITRYESDLRDIKLRQMAERGAPLRPARKPRFASTRQFLGRQLVTLGNRLQTAPLALTARPPADTSGSTT